MSDFVADEIVSFLAFCTVSLFLGMATFRLSSTSYVKTSTLSLEDLIRTLITSFYVVVLSIGYFFSVTSLAAALLIMYPNPVAISLAILIGLPTWTQSKYLFVYWALAIVVSLVEENCHGFNALRRASLLKDNRVGRFMLNFWLNVNVLMMSQGLRMLY